MDIFRKPRIISSNDQDKYYRFVGGVVGGDFVDLNLPDITGSATLLTDANLDISGVTSSNGNGAANQVAFFTSSNEISGGDSFTYDGSAVTIENATLSVPNGFSNAQIVGTGNTIGAGSSDLFIFGNDNVVDTPSTTDFIVFGDGNDINSGNTNLIFGRNNFCDESNNLLFGQGISTDSANVIAFGNDLYTGGERVVLIGNKASAFDVSTSNYVGIGYKTVVGEKEAISIGSESYSDSIGDIVIGGRAFASSSTTSPSIVLGHLAGTDQDNIFQIGSNVNRIVVTDASLYTSGEIVEGSVSGARGRVAIRNFSGTEPEEIRLIMLNNLDFQVSENAVGQTSGQTQAITEVNVPQDNISKVRFNRGFNTVEITNSIDISGNLEAESVYVVDELVTRGGTPDSSENVVIGESTTIASSANNQMVLIGDDSTNSGNGAVVIGYGATNADDSAIVIGRNATAADGVETICIGSNAKSRARQIIIGANSNPGNRNPAGLVVVGHEVNVAAVNSDTILIGSSVTTLGSSSGDSIIAIGTGAASNSGNTILIGNGTSVTAQGSIAIGVNAQTTQANQLQIGDSTAIPSSADAPIYSIRINDGSSETSIENPMSFGSYIEVGSLTPALSGNMLTWDENNRLVDSGFSASSVVYLTGNQTISGEKTFSDNMIVDAESLTISNI